MKISQKSVGATQPPALGSKVWYDDEQRGFGVRVTEAGIRAFIFNYSLAGRERRYTIGRWPEWSADAARIEARRLRVDVDNGVDPLAARESACGEDTMADLARQYLEEHARVQNRESSVYNNELLLKNHILPKLGRLRVSAVTKRDIKQLHASLKPTPYTGNRVLSLLSSMFTSAIEWGLRLDNPARGGRHGIERFKEHQRKVFLSQEQLHALAQALDSYPRDSANALRLLIVTGARSSEVRTAEWPHFNLETGIWTKPHRLTKEGEDECVPLSDAALALLRHMAQSKTNSTYLFPGEDGMCARVSLKRAWIQVCRRAGLAREYHVIGKRGKLLSRWRPIFRIHDLRHSFASLLVSLGVPIYSVSKLLCHRNLPTTERYAHVANQPLRAATNSFPKVLELNA